MSRQEYIDGLRQLVDFLEATPDLPEPRINGNIISWSSFNDAAEVARLASLLPGIKHKNDPASSDYNATYYILTSDVKFGPFSLEVASYRSTVCERVEVGMEQIEVAAVEAVEAHVEQRPVFEYQCSPLLAKAVAS